MPVSAARSAPTCASSSRDRRRCSPRRIVAWRERTGHAILERYGMTETNMIASNPYDGERRAGTVGFPLPGVSLRIAEPESGAPVADGEIGVIEVKGPNVFKGYWRMPEKTAAEFRADGYFITGDLGLIDARRLRPHRRTRQGPRHLGRLQRLSEGGRGRDRRDRRRSRKRGHRVPHPDFGEARDGGRRAASGRGADGGRHRRARSKGASRASRRRGA